MPRAGRRIVFGGQSIDPNTQGPKGTVYRFDSFTLDLVRGALLAASGTEIALRPKAFSALKQLVENAGRLISRDELMAAIWSGVVVTEDSVTQVIKEVRRALGDDAQRLLRTVPRRGFLFAAEVSSSDDQATLIVLPPEPELPPPPAKAARSANGRAMLVVLPFANMTGDPTQEYFIDGIIEDLTTALSNLRWFSVISRNSAFAYKGRSVDVRDVGRELGVGYVLEGSVRKAGSRVRITAQLCEVEAGAQIWAGRFDGDLAHIFDLQDQLTADVVGAIEPNLRLAEVMRVRSKPTESLTSYDLYLRARPHTFVTREGGDESLRLLRRSVALDPGFSAAKGALAHLHSLRFTHGWSLPGDREEAVHLAREVVDSGGEDLPSALAWAGYALIALGDDFTAGSAAVQRALRLAPNSASVLLLAGWERNFGGDGAGAVPHLERALRLSPADTGRFYVTAALGVAKFWLRDYAEAAALARIALADRPTYLTAHRTLVASLAQLGDRPRTEAALRAMLAAAPGYTIAKAAARAPLPDPVLFEALRRAGLPE